MIGRRGYVDPTLGPPQTLQERTLYEAVRKGGLALHRLHANSRAVRLTGPGGVHITAASIAVIKLSDIEPNQHKSDAA